jgi:hypothetical protein
VPEYGWFVAGDDNPYVGLRDLALHTSDVRGIRGPIAAVVFDIPAEDGFVTFAAFADGTTSFYTSAGGGTLGSGNFRPVAEATRNLLRTVASHGELFGEADTGDWPSAGTVRFHLVSSNGNRFLDVPESEFWEPEDHERRPLVEAAQGVVTGIRRVQDAQSASLPRGATRLMASAQRGDLRSLEGLLDYGARLEAQDDNGYTALMYAANAGRDDAVRALLAAGAYANAEDRQMSTPLMFAAQGGHAQMVRMLLEAGADPSVRGAHGLTARGFAEQNGHSEAAGILAEAGGS